MAEHTRGEKFGRRSVVGGRRAVPSYDAMEYRGRRPVPSKLPEPDLSGAPIESQVPDSSSGTTEGGDGSPR